MFTGIIADLGRVAAVSRPADTRFRIETAWDTEAIAIGASIACSGACLTVIETGAGWFAVEVSEETLSRTTLGEWRPGTPVNLERALRLGEELGGHLVTGHVDGVAEVLAVEPRAGSLTLTVRPARELARFIAAKGSVTLEGVSLTVNEVRDKDDGTSCFTVNIIPHSAEVTTLGGLAAGRRLNLEIDLLARYLERLTSQARSP
jgi:riboflavin synthase